MSPRRPSPYQVWTLMDGQLPMFVVVEVDPVRPRRAQLLHWFVDEADAEAWVAEREALRGSRT